MPLSPDIDGRAGDDADARERAEQALRESERSLALELAAMARLQEVSRRLVQAGDSTSLLQEIVDAAIAITSADMGCVWLCDPESCTLRLVASRGFDEAARAALAVVRSGEGISGAALRDGERVVVEDVAASSLLADAATRDAVLACGIRAAQATPLVARSGELVGMLTTHYRQPRSAMDRDLRVVDMLARQAADWIERTRAEEAARASEERLRQLVSLMPAGVYTCDVEGRITLHNLRATELWGWQPWAPPPDPRYCGSRRLWRTDDTPLPHEESPVAQVLREGRSLRDVEVVMEQPGGARLVVSVNVDPLYDREGRLAGAVNVFEDITDRKRAEEALRQSEQRFRSVFECNMVPMGVWTRDGGIEAANDALLDLVGYTREDLASGTLNWERLTPPELVHRDRLSLAEIDSGGVGSPFEKEYIHKDGYRVPILIGGAAFPGTTERGVFVAIDLTDRKRAEEERRALLASEREARAAAEQASRSKDDFLATVSHELRTPLTAVLAWVVLLKRGRLDEGTYRRALDAMERGVNTQLRLIDDLLDLSRIISGKLHIEMGPVDLQAVLHSAIDTVASSAASRGVAIRHALEAADAPLRGDATRLQQVFWNLLANAIKFTPPGGEVEVRSERQGARLVVSVRDTGQGIDPDVLPHIFERFRQGDGSVTRRHAGLGLGLAIVKYLVEQHGGSVTVESAGVGRGSTFLVSLPAVPSAGATEQALGLPLSDEVDFAGVRILFVDDDRDAQVAVARVLSECKAEITTASSADQALELLPAVRPHVLISDIGMPGKDGYALIREVRRSSEHKRLPAIALTAFARAEDRIRALKAGYNMHVAKPVDPRELLTVVASLVVGGEG